MALGGLLWTPWRRWCAERFRLLRPSTGVVFGPLDTARGLSALFVAAFHAWQWLRPLHDRVIAWMPVLRQGGKPVAIFCVLSGCLVYRSAQTVPSLPHYLRRRFFRIYPLYAAAVGLSALGGFLGWRWKTLFLVGSDLLMLRAFGAPSFIVPPAWSLYVEELFYVLLPTWRAALVSSRRMIPVCAVGTLVLTLLDGPGPPELALIKYFLIGIMVAHWLETPPPRGRALGAFGFGGALLVGDFMDWWQVPRLHPEYTLGLGVGTALCLLGAVWHPRVNTLMSLAPLRALGTISYSVYLMHPFVLLWDVGGTFTGTGRIGPLPRPMLPLDTIWPFWGLVLPAIIFWAACSYCLIERPFLRWR